jgi:hypothetical protein
LPATSARTISRERAAGKRQSLAERGDEEARLRRRQRLREVAARFLRGIEVVERLGHDEVGVRVEDLRELVALVAQVRLDLELTS